MITGRPKRCVVANFYLACHSCGMGYQFARPDNPINLTVGQPDPALLPVDLFQGMALARSDLAYGEEKGDSFFRSVLAGWLSAEYGQQVDPENLLVTTGSTNALDLISARLARPGDAVLVEDPSYFVALKLFSEHGLRPISVPMDEQGLSAGALAQAIEEHKPAFIYTIPAFHNPTGITQTDDRRRELVALAKAHQCPLVADEVYQSLYFEQAPPPVLACYDEQAPVFSVGTFSKILAPGLRLGWIHSNARWLPRLTESPLFRSGGGLSPISSALVAPLIESGRFQQQLAETRRNLIERMETLSDGLERAFDQRLAFTRPAGGYFIWATFTDGTRTADFQQACRAQGVSCLPGDACSATGAFSESLRVCFAWYDKPALSQACDRLALAFS
ncbi:PLP-dependent aminotransferase family protein [Marinobacterium litorale]|uniref:aminotransferase-like domain-containing protein n=1 Tax=Marinobacterium litorale TaxID=404770 RepID=UPI000422F1E3|nr:PLP-dependent aminotransferase family protein [Marinobacterium litorale]